MIRPTHGQTAATLVFATELVLAAVIWRLGPVEPIPMHFNATGAVDHYGSRSALAALTAGMALFGGVCWLILEAMRQRADRPRSIGWAQIILLLTFSLVGLMFAYMAFGRIGATASAGSAVRMAGISVLTAGIGAFLGKAGPNPFVGVRTFWSLNSRLAWEKSNRLGGRLLFWIGMTGLITSPFAPQPFGSQAIIAAIIISALASIFESWRVWRADPERARF